ncbi:uncharacterized protein LOC144098313 [Amblyomma americanum]
MDVPHLESPEKRITGPQYCSTPIRSSCAQDDGAADESDISTFLSTLDEFVERCDSFLVPNRSTPSEHDATVVHAQVAVPGRRDSAAGAEVNLQENSCSIQCDCFVEGDNVDYGECVDETENDTVFGDCSECTEACSPEPCDSCTQNAIYCSGQISWSDQDYADHLGGDDYCQNLECEQGYDTCGVVYQEPGSSFTNPEQRKSQNSLNEMGKKRTHIALSFCQENAYGYRTHGKEEGEQSEQHAGSFDESSEYHEEPEVGGIEEFNYHSQGNYENYEGDDTLYPEECHKANHRDDWEEHHCFDSGHRGQVDFTAHKSPDNVEGSSVRNEFEQYDGHLSKSYQMQDSFGVDKEREKASLVSYASSAFNSNHQQLEEAQVQRFTKSFNGSCEYREHEEPKEAQLKRYQESFSSGCKGNSCHHYERYCERTYSKGLCQYPDHYNKSFALQEAFTSGEKIEHTRHVPRTHSEPTLAQSFNHQQLEKRSKPCGTSFQGIRVIDDEFAFNKHGEESDKGNEHDLPSFTYGCQRKDSCNPEIYLERHYKNDLDLYPNNYSRSSAPWKAFASGINNKSARWASCTSTAGSLKHQEIVEARNELCVSSFNSSSVMDDAFTDKQYQEEPEQEARSELCAPSFNSSCVMEDVFTVKQHQEEPEQETISELCASSFNSSYVMEDVFTVKQHQEGREQKTRNELPPSSFNSSCVMEDVFTVKEHQEEPEQETRSELCASSFNSSCVMEDVFTVKQHKEEPGQETRSELCASSFNSSCVMEDVFIFEQHREDPVQPEHKLNAGSFSRGPHRGDGHVSERCLKELHEKESNQYSEQENLERNFLPSNVHKSNFGARIPPSVGSVRSSNNLVCSSGHHAQIFSCSSVAVEKKSSVCAAAHDKVCSCDANNSLEKGMSEGCYNLSPSEKKGDEGEGSAANSKAHVMQSKVFSPIPDLTAPDKGKNTESRSHPWLREADVGNPAFFTGIVQAAPDDCIKSATCRRDVQAAPISHNAGSEPGPPLPGVENDSADSLHDGEPGDSNYVLECNFLDENRGALAVSEDRLNSEVAAVEDNAANAVARIANSDQAPTSNTYEVSDNICNGTESHDFTLIAANDCTASSTSKHDLSSPSQSVMSEDVLDISVGIDEDDTFVAEVESPVASTKKTKEQQRPHVQTMESKAESPMPVCKVLIKDEHTQDPPDVYAQPCSSGSAMLAPPFSEQAPSKVEADSSRNEDMRKKIDSIRRQRGQQSEHRLPHSHEDLHAQASCSRTVGDRGVEHQGPSSEAPGTKRRAPFMSENPEENMDNENPEWEAVRRLTTEEERYQAVKKVWHNSSVPDPHQELTTFHYRRHLLGLKHSNTPARKCGKRKASHDSSSAKPAKRQRFDTDIIDLKLKELERKKEKDVTRAHDMFRYGMDMLHRDFRINEAQSSRYRGRPHHRRARTAPWDFRYYQMQERRIHEEFMASAQSINSAYSVRANKLLNARDEVRRFDAFYAGLQDSDPRLLSEQQIKENLKLEELLGRFNVAYGAAKD